MGIQIFLLDLSFFTLLSEPRNGVAESHGNSYHVPQQLPHFTFGRRATFNPQPAPLIPCSLRRGAPGSRTKGSSLRGRMSTCVWRAGRSPAWPAQMPQRCTGLTLRLKAEDMKPLQVLLRGGKVKTGLHWRVLVAVCGDGLD